MHIDYTLKIGLIYHLIPIQSCSSYQNSMKETFQILSSCLNYINYDDLTTTFLFLLSERYE